MNYSKLNLTGSSAPHIRTAASTRFLMGEVITALLPALCFAVYSFGPRAAVNALVSAAGCCVFELLYRLVRRQNITVGDLSAVLTGLLLALSCPVTVPYWLLLAGDLAAILIKQLPGGLGKNILNPALTARMVLLLWGGDSWISPRTAAPLWDGVDAVTSPTPLALLRQGGLAGLEEVYSLPELLVGLTSGAAGEVSALLLLTGGLFLIARRTISWRIPASLLGAAAAFTFLFPQGNDRIGWMLCQLLSGGLLLGAFFIATDPVTSPVSPGGQLLYGAGCGLLTVLLRRYGICSEGIGFAILLMNLAVRPLDGFLLAKQVPEFTRLLHAVKQAKPHGKDNH